MLRPGGRGAIYRGVTLAESSNLLAAWIGAGLRDAGRTQRGLARALGLDPATVNRILKGKRRLRIDEIEPAARYLGVEAPNGFSPRACAAPDYIDLPAELRSSVFRRATEMEIEPEEFLARAVRAALLVLGPQAGGDREGAA